MNTVEPSQRKTGYIYKDEGNGFSLNPRPPKESWHRTLSGALEARRRNGYHGNVYRITCDDTTEPVRL